MIAFLPGQRANSMTDSHDLGTYCLPPDFILR
jgi:hypothetical protein